MKFRCKNRSLCNYGKEYEVEVVARYVNGYKARLLNTDDIAFVQKCDIEILEISEEEANMPIAF